jgi:hypothetical protein
MRRHAISTSLVAVALGVLAVTAAACGDSSGMADNVALNATTTTLSPGPGRLSVPVTVETNTVGTMRAIVHVSVGGGHSVPVLLDTGSAGLRILPSDVGRAVIRTGQTETATFGGGIQLTSATATATVNVGGASTPSSTEVSLIQSSGCASGFPSCQPGQGISELLGASGVDGILGVAMSDSSTAQSLYSPLLQLRAPYRNGFTLSLPAGGPDSLILGTPRSTSNTITVPMHAATPSTYPNGVPAWQKDVNLCWTVNDLHRGCSTTDLDTGTPETVITPTGLPGIATTGQLAQGDQISVSTPNGVAVWGYTTTDTPGGGLTVISPLPGTTQFNTGIGFFTSFVVGYDAQKGVILVTAG